MPPERRLDLGSNLARRGSPAHRHNRPRLHLSEVPLSKAYTPKFSEGPTRSGLIRRNRRVRPLLISQGQVKGVRHEIIVIPWKEADLVNQARE
jgi:hypothetical protein